MNSQNSKLKGVINSSLGAVKQTAGKAINDPDLESSGLAQKVEGNIQKVQGVIEEKLEKATRTIGGAIENVGKKLTNLVD